jgi:hypothetical protein
MAGKVVSLCNEDPLDASGTEVTLTLVGHWR